jgi:uncharacterized membrane protein YsdA (DUF1294 family)
MHMNRKTTARPPRQTGAKHQSSLLVIKPLLALVFLSGLAIASINGVLNWIYPTFYVLASAACMLAYRQDKLAAQAQQWRISENRLHLLSVAGGWPGALLAQAWLRHKHRKLGFMLLFWSCVLLNLAVLLLCVSSALRSAAWALAQHPG